MKKTSLREADSKSGQKPGSPPSVTELTHLPGQTLLKDRFERAVSQLNRRGHAICLMLVSIDNLPGLELALGREVADLVIQEFAGRLQQLVRRSDTVAALARNRFVVLSPVSDSSHSAIVLEKLTKAVRMPITLGQHELTVTCKAGVSIAPMDGDDYATLLANATDALRRAKRRPGNCYEFFSPTIQEAALTRLDMEIGLRQALASGQMRLFYQPKVDIATGEIVGAEALLRWMDEERGCIEPEEFIPIAEESDLIEELGEWVIRETCRQNSIWQKDGLQKIRISLNVSPRQFGNRLVEVIASSLSENELDGQFLELELTESTLVEDLDTAISLLQQTRAMGVVNSIDDFGTGYSSLNHLARLPVDGLKIDRSFIKDVTEDPDVAEISRIIIELAHVLRLTVVAEGAETPGQTAFLQKHNCDTVQGFLYSPPVSADTFELLLREKPFPALAAC